MRAGLVAGMELDRTVLRHLRAELRRAEAVATAARAVSNRDVSARRLHQRLVHSGVRRPEAEATVERFVDLGLVDDARLAARRAAALAERGWGDAAIAARLEHEGVETDLIRSALADLAPEHDRAAAVAARERDRRKAASLLARRGFSPDAIEATLGSLDGEG